MLRTGAYKLREAALRQELSQQVLNQQRSLCSRKPVECGLVTGIGPRMRLMSAVSDASCACFGKEIRTLCMKTMVARFPVSKPGNLINDYFTNVGIERCSGEWLNWLDWLDGMRGRCRLQDARINRRSLNRCGGKRFRGRGWRG